MADPSYHFEDPAEMDYPEHERTFELFLNLTKWGTIGVIGILLGMLVGLIGGGGFLGGVAIFLLTIVGAYFLL